jgi:hypothetical protein
VIKTPTSVTQPLPKRRAILALVQALHAAGVPATKLAAAVPENKLRPVEGVLDGDALWEQFRVVHQQALGRRKRWFIDEPLREDSVTWVLFRNWGLNTESTLDALLRVGPEGFPTRENEKGSRHDPRTRTR